MSIETFSTGKHQAVCDCCGGAPPMLFETMGLAWLFVRELWHVRQNHMLCPQCLLRWEKQKQETSP